MFVIIYLTWFPKQYLSYCLVVVFVLFLYLISVYVNVFIHDNNPALHVVSK